MSTCVLGYWNIRGLAASIRYILEYAGAKYEDKRYNCGPPPTFDRTEWFNEKFTLGLDFPNLPYLIDGDVKLSQSGVIVNYLARKHGLVGKNEQDQLRAETLQAQLRDYHQDLCKICYDSKFEELKVDFAARLPGTLESLSKFLGDRKFVVGDYVTYADFLLLEYLESLLFFDPSCLKDFKNLEQYHQRILALDAIDKYFKSDRCIKYPFFGAPAYFGGAYSDMLSKST